ncbi:MAG: M91 family zinc metallopeptidase [Pseudomonadota bacterium]
MEVQSGFEGIYIDPNPMHPFMGRPLYSGTDWAVEKGQFTRNTMADLRRLAATTLGAELIDLIGKRSQGIGTKASGRARSVTIAFRPSNNPGASTGASIRIDDKFGVTKRVGNRDIRFAGRGSAAKIQMHNRLGQSEGIYTRLAGVYSPVWVVLAHELIHALHTST